MKKILGCLGILAILVSGCATKPYSPTEYPVYVYDQSFDVVYLKTYEVLDRVEDWTPLTTDKSKGHIDVKNKKYGNLFDLDIQTARFVLKMISRTQTSLTIDVDHSRCKDDACLKLLEAVDEVIVKLPKKVAKPAEGDQPTV